MKPQSLARLLPSDPQVKRGADAVPSGAQPIDLVHLTRQTFGDKRLESELLRLFLRQSRQIGQCLAQGETSGEQAAPSVELLHMLSGSARAIGATAVAAMAGALETRLRQTGDAAPEAAEREALCGLLERTDLYIADLLDQA